MVMTNSLSLQLLNLGLSDKQARVYSALLELGSASPAEVARRAQIKRSTTYVILESLQSQGLVERSPGGSRSVFTIDDPKKLTDLIEKRGRLAAALLPILTAQTGTARAKPLVRLYEGTEAIFKINTMWRILAKQPQAPKNMDWYGSIGNLQKGYKGLLEKNYAVWREQKLHVRELIGGAPADKVFAKMHQSPLREFRFLPKNQKIAIDFGIFGNQTAIFQLRRRPFALLIESTEIAEAMRGLFNLAWIAAKKS